MPNTLSNKANIIITNNSLSIEISPQSLKPTYESLASDDSGRTADGAMYIGNWLKRKLTKLEITLPPYSVDNALYSSVLSYVQGQEYQITYWDIVTKQEKTMNCYTSNSSADWYSGVIVNGLVQSCSFNAIAMDEDSSVAPISSVQTNKSVTYDRNGTYTVSPDSGYTSMQNVTVTIAGSIGPVPSGTLTVTAPGTYDCTSYASVNVNIPTYSGEVR